MEGAVEVAAVILDRLVDIWEQNLGAWSHAIRRLILLLLGVLVLYSLVVPHDSVILKTVTILASTCVGLVYFLRLQTRRAFRNLALSRGAKFEANRW